MFGGGGPTIVQNTPVVMENSLAELETDEMRERVRQQKLQKKIDNSITGGDGIVGEENLQKDIGIADIDSFQKDYEMKYGKAEASFHWNRVLTMGVAGGLCGCIGCLLYYQESVNTSYFQQAMIGVFSGGLAGVITMALIQTYLMWRAESRDPFKMALEQHKETLRRMEMEAFERHDEFIYYDANKEHSRCYSLMCCPNYGKITNKRIIYTEPNPVECPQCPCYPISICPCIPDALTGCWCKRIETMDYRLIDDVSVEQGCCDFLMGSGSVIVHCHGSSDISIIAAERTRLVKALQSREIVDLKQAIRICDRLEHKSGLKEELQEARRMVEELEDKEKAAAKERNEDWHPTYVLDPEDENTAQQIRVLSVTSPFAVMDDLSYRIAASVHEDTKKK